MSQLDKDIDDGIYDMQGIIEGKELCGLCEIHAATYSEERYPSRHGERVTRGFLTCNNCGAIHNVDIRD